MGEHMTRKLRLFLCHATEDKPAVRTLYASLKSVPWIDPWLDEENLLPGQDWDLEIYRATRDADAIIICLSTISVKKEGYLNKEIRQALSIAEEKTEGAIYVIPLRLDDCIPSFEQLKKLQWADYFMPNAHERLLASLGVRAESVGGISASSENRITEDLCKFIYCPPKLRFFHGAPFWISKYPVTNAQYKRFLESNDYTSEKYWRNFPIFEEFRFEGMRQVGKFPKTDSGKAGIVWLDKARKWYGNLIQPRSWNDPNLGHVNWNAPVVNVTWYEANAYCKWLQNHWDELIESKANLRIGEILNQTWFRLPTRLEWQVAAGIGMLEHPSTVARFPWDKKGESTKDLQEIFSRANVSHQIGKTTPVTQYPNGASPRSVMDMSGNVCEWLSTLNFKAEHLIDDADEMEKEKAFEYNLFDHSGSSWKSSEDEATLDWIYAHCPNDDENDLGFRVLICEM